MKARRKSEDNPNTQITILFCSKSLSIIRPDDFTDCFLVKAQFVKTAADDYLPGLRRVRRSSIAPHTLVQSQALHLAAFTAMEESFPRSPSVHWTLISTRRFFARPSRVLLSAIGLLSPNPCPETRPPSTPFFTT